MVGRLVTHSFSLSLFFLFLPDYLFALELQYLSVSLAESEAQTHRDTILGVMLWCPA